MNNKILLIMVIFAIILISGISVAKPDIQNVKIKSTDTDSEYDIEVIVKDGDSIDDVKSNDEKLSEDENIPEKWKGNRVKTDENGIMKIEAKDDHDNSETKFYGSGGCTGNYESHKETYSYANVRQVISGSSTTFYLDSTKTKDSSIIGICVYPEPGFDQSNDYLNIASPLFGKWVPKHSDDKDYFGFGRKNGNENIPLDGVTNREIGTAYYGTGKDSSRILMHISDKSECEPDNTCWRRPGTTDIPEFPTFVIPVAAAIVIMFIVRRKMK